MSLAALDDLQEPVTSLGDHLRHLGPLIASVGKDALDEGKRSARRPQQLARPIPVLDIGGMDDHAQQQAEGVDEDVPLAPRDLLARIKALRVERSAPF